MRSWLRRLLHGRSLLEEQEALKPPAPSREEQLEKRMRDAYTASFKPHALREFEDSQTGRYLRELYAGELTVDLLQQVADRGDDAAEDAIDQYLREMNNDA